MPIMDAVSTRVVIALLEDWLQNSVSGLITGSELKEIFSKALAAQLSTKSSNASVKEYVRGKDNELLDVSTVT